MRFLKCRVASETIDFLVANVEPNVKRSQAILMTCLAKRGALGLRFSNLGARDDGGARPGGWAHEWILGACGAGER